MGKATGMGKTSARGGFKLFIGVAISSILTAVSLILVMNFLDNPDNYGIVATALIFPILISSLKDWGINAAMVKYLAQYKSENRIHSSKKVMTAGLLFELITGVLLTLASFLLADMLAGILATETFPKAEVKILIEFASFTILADSFLKISQSTFIGFERMEFHSLTMILNSTIRCFLAPLLVYLGYSVLGAIQGQIVAQLVAGTVGLVIFYVRFFRQPMNMGVSDLNIKTTLKMLLKYGMPLSVSVIVLGFLPPFYNALLTQSIPTGTNISYTNVIGNFQAAVNFTVLITFFTVPIATVLLPAFSKLKPKEEEKTLRIVFNSSVKYGALLTIPVTLMIMVLSEPLVFALLGVEYTEAPFFLTLYSILFLYTGLGRLSFVAFLNGQGKTEITMRLFSLTLGMGLLLGWLLIPQFGAVGLIATNLIAGLPALFVGLWWIRKHFGATVDWKASAKIFLASGIAAVVTYLLLSPLNASNRIEWLIEVFAGGIIFLVVYLVAAPLIRAVDKNDVRSLREMLSGLGPFSYVFNIPLKIIEKLSTIFEF
ncbi:MAG: polysaccharide biosynthesis protein [Candidatus Bathyarchaeum sp.]|nr:MAG: polysaccharide biosynthesis protein [Candidatus Bathyarchaeum sp.]